MTNLVCAMNLNVTHTLTLIFHFQEGANVTATKVLDEVSGGNFGTEDEDSLVSDKALKVSERISNHSLYLSFSLGMKTGLKQVFLSLNIPMEAV